MKKIIFLSSFILLILVSCNDDDSTSATRDNIILSNNQKIDAYDARIPFMISPFLPLNIDESDDDFIQVKYDRLGRVVTREGKILERETPAQIGVSTVPYLYKNYNDTVIYENNKIKIYQVLNDSSNTIDEPQLISSIELDALGRIMKKRNILDIRPNTNPLRDDINARSGELFPDYMGPNTATYIYNDSNLLTKIITIYDYALNEIEEIESNPHRINQEYVHIPKDMVTSFEYDKNSNLIKKIISKNNYFTVAFLLGDPSSDDNTPVIINSNVVEINYSRYDDNENHFKSLSIFDDLLDLSLSSNNFSRIESTKYYCRLDRDNNFDPKNNIFEYECLDPYRIYNNSLKFKYLETEEGMIQAIPDISDDMNN